MEEREIEFYIPECEEIPTRLRLLVRKDDGKDITVYYKRLEHEFGYEFEVYDALSVVEANEIVNQIAQTMCNQSFDHGSEWRIESIECVKSDINFAYSHVDYVVKFRIKDSY